ncbi:MAG: toll/interleukin-1 receptor domain-containing protein [Ktedonobacteraceae bacterium]|nr:toll/interleukin-1 receptor domain-containing protein [Ktedonobacteraceae bacterium]
MAVTVLLCYAPEDQRLANDLKKHLSLLERNAFITIWDDGDIGPGMEWEQETKKRLDVAQMILLLISASFLNSHYCFGTAVQHAITRHEHKEARVIPVILRPCHWEEPPLDKLQALPNRARPIVNWPHRDDGFTNVARGIAQVVKLWNSHSLPDPTAERKMLMAQLDQLIEAVRSQLQPPPRAQTIASTLQQLSIFVPNDVTLADLIAGWRTLSQSSQQGEEPPVVQRRVTCGELAALASQLTTEQGSIAQAIKTWGIWRDAFNNSDDPRQNAMTKTFARELSELEEAFHK